MAESASPLPVLEWDVVEDPDGFSAEIVVDRPLGALELEAFSQAVRELPLIEAHVADVDLSAAAIVDEGTLWLSVHAVGPGRCESAVSAAAEELLRDRWHEIHEHAWRIQWSARAS